MAQHIKPDGITGLNTGHSLYANITKFYEFGQLDKELVADVAVSLTNAAVTDSADIGDARTITTTTTTSETIAIPDDSTVLVVCRPKGTRANGDPSSYEIFTLNSGDAARFRYRGYSGGYFEVSHRGNFSSYKHVSNGSLGDDPTYQTGHAIAAHLTGTGTMKTCRNGTIGANTEATVTQNFSTSPVTAALFPSLGSETDTDVGAIVVFNKLLSDAELQSVTNNPWDLVQGAAVFSVDSISNATPTPGTSVTVSMSSGTGPYTATLNGKTLTATSQAANSFTFDCPDPMLFDDKTLLFNTSYTLEMTDANTDTDTITLSITPLGQYQLITNMPAPTDSILTGSGAVDGDYFHATWTANGNSQLFPSDGDPNGLDLPSGQTHTVDVSVYSDHDSNSTKYWSAIGTWNLVSNDPSVALTAAVIQAAGTSVLLAFSEAVTFGAGGNGGLTLTLSGGAVTATYASGSGTNQLTYNLSRTIKSNETGTLDYTQPTDGIERLSDNADLASVASFSVTNESAQAPVVPTITTQPVNVSVADSQAFSFSVVANTGGLADPITYQWYDASDDSVIAGATSATYSGTATTALNGNTYYCRLTSSEGGTVDTDTVTLTVTASSKRLVTQQLVDRQTSPATVLINTLFNYRVRNAAGAIVVTSTGTSDNSGILTLDNTGFGAVGETVYLEILLASNSYAGFELTVQATP